MTPGFKEYLDEAFHAKPWGMFVSPNWLVIAGFLFGGFLNPGVWVLGVGIELGYLFLMANNPRFQRLVRAQALLEAQRQWTIRQQGQVTNLNRADQARYHQLEQRCKGILEQQRALDTGGGDLKAQGEGLARLTWIYLRLLLTQQAINKVLGMSAEHESEKPVQAINRVLGVSTEPESDEPLADRIARLGKQVHDQSLSEDVRKSLAGQMEILQQRLEKQKEARDKLAFLDAELTRIEEQVELIREQAAVSADPKVVSDRIDQVSADLSGQSQWLREQQQLYGKVEDLLSEPPPLNLDSPKVAEGQK